MDMNITIMATSPNTAISIISINAQAIVINNNTIMKKIGKILEMALFVKLVINQAKNNFLWKMLFFTAINLRKKSKGITKLSSKTSTFKLRTSISSLI